MTLGHVPINLRQFCVFNDTATSEIYTLSLHDALPIYAVEDHEIGAAHEGGKLRIGPGIAVLHVADVADAAAPVAQAEPGDRKSTRLNSSHANISYAVFCLKKKPQCNATCLHILIYPFY